VEIYEAFKTAVAQVDPAAALALAFAASMGPYTLALPIVTLNRRALARSARDSRGNDGRWPVARSPSDDRRTRI
jgi:hypothetical protein